MEIHHLSVQVISIGHFKDRFDSANTRHCLVMYSVSLLPIVIVGDEGAIHLHHLYQFRWAFYNFQRQNSLNNRCCLFRVFLSLMYRQTVEDEDGEPPPLISPGDCKYILVPLFFLRQELVHVASYTVC